MPKYIYPLTRVMPSGEHLPQRAILGYSEEFLREKYREILDFHIRECMLDEVILGDLRRVTAMAREFAEYIGSRQSARSSGRSAGWNGN